MAVYPTSKFITAIKRKGFVPDKTHHNMFWYYLDGKKTSVRTRTSHEENEFNDGLMTERCKQIGLTSKEQMLDLIECPLSADDLQQILIESGRIREPEPKEATQ